MRSRTVKVCLNCNSEFIKAHPGISREREFDKCPVCFLYLVLAHRLGYRIVRTESWHSEATWHKPWTWTRGYWAEEKSEEVRELEKLYARSQ